MYRHGDHFMLHRKILLIAKNLGNVSISSYRTICHTSVCSQ
ncbi:hypothetical protein [Azospirillum doebereinerae]